MIKNRIDFALLGATEQVRRDVTSEQYDEGASAEQGQEDHR